MTRRASRSAGPRLRSASPRPAPLQDWDKAASRRFHSLRTFGQIWRWAQELYETHGLAFGQVASTAHDESLYLLLRVLDWPLDSGPEALKRALTAAQREVAREAIRRRVMERVPAAYITREAWLGGQRFFVDERVIIPRSYFVELIPTQLESWLPAGVEVKHAADICTGSGCLAILLAGQFPRAKVDAVDLSPDALAVAEINCRAHRMARRISLHRSDVFGGVPPVKYDVIVSNPPYEPSGLVNRLPAEFQAEPRLALDGGADGMDIVRRLIKQARSRLKPHGILAIEVGALHDAVNREFAKREPHWLHTADGSDCVVLFQAARL
ncbi:MAG TPA: 50S ribosomal protein L3 N(5)-glutamine methyltransferase [Opitutaceae bacterium]